MLITFLIAVSSLALVTVSLLACYILKNFIFSTHEENKSSKNEAILITGCDSGIGFELAKHFYQNSEFIIICGCFQTFKSEGYKYLEKLAWKDESNRLILKQLDLRSTFDIQNLTETIEDLKKKNDQFKGLTALINNAGIMTFGEFDWLTWDHIQSQIEVNLLGTLRLTRALVPYVIRSKGRIINVSSVNDSTVFPGLSIYSATKGALSIFARGLGYELRKFGAHVITVRLGDFARLTNIMSDHAKSRDDMWNGMDATKQSIYKDFFHEFNDHLLKNYGMTSPRKFSDSSLFKDFRRAVLAKNPPTTITCAPLSFKVFYLITELIPVWMQYYILDLLFHIGFKWKPTSVITE